MHFLRKYWPSPHLLVAVLLSILPNYPTILQANVGASRNSSSSPFSFQLWLENELFAADSGLYATLRQQVRMHNSMSKLSNG